MDRYQFHQSKLQPYVTLITGTSATKDSRVTVEECITNTSVGLNKATSIYISCRDGLYLRSGCGASVCRPNEYRTVIPYLSAYGLCLSIFPPGCTEAYTWIG